MEIVLYVFGDAPNSSRARRNLAAFCHANPAMTQRFEVVDLITEPERGVTDRVVVTPHVVVKSASMVRHIIGDLSDTTALAEACAGVVATQSVDDAKAG